MKMIRTTAAAVFGLSLAAAALAQSEGVAEFKGTMSGGPGKSVPSTGRVYFRKGAAYRTEWEMDLTGIAKKETAAPKGMMPSRYRMVMIQKLSDLDHMVTVNDDTKTYSITDLKQLREEMPSAARTTYTVKKLGRDSVAGLACEKALVTSSSGSEMELCVSTDLFPSAAFLAAQNRRDRSNNLLSALKENGLNGFPIRWVAREKGDQRVVGTMELVRLDWKPVPASLFEIPPGYRETSAMGVMMTPEQEKAMKDALEKMTPEQRKQYEEMMKSYSGRKKN